MKIRLLIAVLLICLDTHAQSWEISARSGFCVTSEELNTNTTKGSCTQAEITNSIFIRHSFRKKWALEFSVSTFNVKRTFSEKYNDTSVFVFHSKAFSNFVPIGLSLQHKINGHHKKLSQYIGVSLTYQYQVVTIGTTTALQNKQPNYTDVLSIVNIGGANNCIYTGLNYNVSYNLTKRLKINCLIEERVNFDFWGEPLDSGDWGSFSTPSLVSSVMMGLSYTL